MPKRKRERKSNLRQAASEAVVSVDAGSPADHAAPVNHLSFLPAPRTFTPQTRQALQELSQTAPPPVDLSSGMKGLLSLLDM